MLGLDEELSFSEVQHTTLYTLSVALRGAPRLVFLKIAGIIHRSPGHYGHDQLVKKPAKRKWVRNSPWPSSSRGIFDLKLNNCNNGWNLY